MSISPLGTASSTLALTNGAASGTSGFCPQLATALGRSHGSGAHRVQETGAIGASPARSMADDARALVGDMFGALGADSSATSPQRAAAAYARAS